MQIDALCLVWKTGKAKLWTHVKRVKLTCQTVCPKRRHTNRQKLPQTGTVPERPLARKRSNEISKKIHFENCKLEMPQVRSGGVFQAEIDKAKRRLAKSATASRHWRVQWKDSINQELDKTLHGSLQLRIQTYRSGARQVEAAFG